MPNQKQDTPVFNVGKAESRKDTNRALPFHTTYDAAGKLMAEYSNQLSNTPQVNYLTIDHLGTPRINTDQDGKVTSRKDFQPFGEEIVRSSYEVDDVRQKFTSFEKDIEIDLEFAQARYYKSSHGRFTSVDPLMASATAINPQTWNRYTYVLNNPLALIDPSGMKPVWLLKNDSHGNIIDVKLADEEEEGFEDLIDKDKGGWQRVEFDENGQFSYPAANPAGGTKTAVLKKDGTWGWEGSLGAKMMAAGTIGGIAGAVAGTEELPVFGTVTFAIGGFCLTAAGSALIGDKIIIQTGAPAMPVSPSTTSTNTPQAVPTISTVTSTPIVEPYIPTSLPLPDEGCKFQGAIHHGGSIKQCIWLCRGYGAPVTWGQDVTLPCPGLKPDGMVDVDKLKPPK